MQDITHCYIHCPTPAVYSRVYDSLILALSSEKIIPCGEFPRLLSLISGDDFFQSLVILEKQSHMSEFTFDALQQKIEQKKSRLIVYDPLGENDLFTAVIDALYPKLDQGGFVCQLPPLPIAHVIHILCQTGVHGVFEVVEKNHSLSGWFMVKKNRLCAARTKDYHGLQALRAICSWQNGVVMSASDTKEEHFSDEDIIEGISTDFLLLQIMHDMDEC